MNAMCYLLALAGWHVIMVALHCGGIVWQWHGVAALRPRSHCRSCPSVKSQWRGGAGDMPGSLCVWEVACDCPVSACACLCTGHGGPGVMWTACSRGMPLLLWCCIIVVHYCCLDVVLFHVAMGVCMCRC